MKNITFIKKIADTSFNKAQEQMFTNIVRNNGFEDFQLLFTVIIQKNESKLSKNN